MLAADTFDTDTIVALPIGWASIVALFLPLLVAYGVKERASTQTPRAVAGIVLAGVVAVVQALTDDIPQDTLQSLLAVFLGVFLPMIGAYYGLWRTLDVNQRLAPTKGV